MLALGALPLGAVALGALPLVASPAGAAAAVVAGGALQAAPAGTGTACSVAAPCSLVTALAAAGSAGDATIELASGTYTSAGGFQLVLSAPAAGGPAAVTLQGAAGGSVLDGGGAAPVLSLAGSGTVSVDGLTLAHGASTGNGGGIADAGGPALSVADSTFLSDQAAGSGGGLAVSGTAGLTVTGSTFAGDTAGGAGGGLSVSGTPATVTGSTFAGDTATSGGGVAGDGGTSLAADVLAGDPGGACAGGMVDAGYLVSDDTTCPAGPGSVSEPDATLFPGGSPTPAALGGPVEVVPLAVAGDPVLRAVPATAVLAGSTAPFCSTTDARGVPRDQPAPGGKEPASGCAPGAFQPAPPVVDQVTPSSAVPGTLITVHGYGLSLVTNVTVAGTTVPFHVLGDNGLQLTVPQSLPSGPVTLAVTSPDATLAGSGPATASLAVAGPLAISTQQLKATETGAVFVQGLFASGGAGGDRWSVSGTLPPGLHVSPGGIVSGIPATPGSFPLAVTVTDQSGAEVHETLVLHVGAGPQITTTSLPPAEVGQTYRFHLLASGGDGRYSWSVPSSTATFPGGLLLSSRGILAGIPGQAGTVPVRFLVTDAAGGRASVTLPLVIAPAPAPPPPPQAYVVASAAGRVTPFGTPLLPGRTARVPGRLAGIAVPPAGGGYWVVTTTGDVVAEGGLHRLGSVGRRYLHGRIVGIAADPAGTGYWLASSTGQVYGFGTARDLVPGSRRAAVAAQLGPVVAIVASPARDGFWLVGATGQVAAFGAAPALGSIGPQRRIHVAAAAADRSGRGYLLISQAGRMFGFGTDRQLGYATKALPGHFVGVATAPNGLGAWLVTSTGYVDPVGSAEALATPPHRLPGGAVAVASAR